MVEKIRQKIPERPIGQIHYEKCSFNHPAADSPLLTGVFMPISQATIATDQPSRYILRLSKHWGHKFSVVFDNEHSRIELGDAVCELQAEDNQLNVLINAPEASLDKMETVVAEHLQRFAPQHTSLAFNWVRGADPETSAL